MVSPEFEFMDNDGRIKRDAVVVCLACDFSSSKSDYVDRVRGALTLCEHDGKEGALTTWK